jgi:hypothetical protein
MMRLHTNQRLLTSLTRDNATDGYDSRLAPYEPLSIRTGVFLERPHTAP